LARYSTSVLHGNQLPTVIGLTIVTGYSYTILLGGDSVPDTDSGSLLHFPYHYGIGDFRRFISISHTVAGRFSQHSAKLLMLTS